MPPEGNAKVFQSPSLRGSGRFRCSHHFPSRCRECFNPLHCGAVVASKNGIIRDPAPPAVSIPFIAGQWSLQLGDPPPAEGGGGSFNPLHCGAVVASPSQRAPARAPDRFNPLHCGAVVASLRGIGRPPTRRRVSIPFIAGQWSLRRSAPLPRRGEGDVSIPFIAGQWSLPKLGDDLSEARVEFQSPSLRGSGRFSQRASQNAISSSRFNPLHCGAVVASFDAEALLKRLRHVSIPFIAGQWSLPIEPSTRRPSSARFNPLHCGAVVASPHGGARRRKRQRVSIPFIAGQWSLRWARRKRNEYHLCFNPLHCGAVVASGKEMSTIFVVAGFNPLHCGAVVASRRMAGGGARGAGVSIPFIAGQWSLRGRNAPSPILSDNVSIPFIAGQWSLPAAAAARGFPGRCFNPLHCGAVVAS